MKLEQIADSKSIGEDHYSFFHDIMEWELEDNCESDFNFSETRNQFKINK